MLMEEELVTQLVPVGMVKKRMVHSATLFVKRVIMELDLSVGKNAHQDSPTLELIV